jgi:hypothetical protein
MLALLTTPALAATEAFRYCVVPSCATELSIPMTIVVADDPMLVRNQGGRGDVNSGWVPRRAKMTRAEGLARRAIARRRVSRLLPARRRS